MEPVTSIVSAIFKVLQQIAKAEREARRNRTRCRDLARRAQVVSNVLRDARIAASRNDAGTTRRMILCRLREALDDALKLVASCGGQSDNSRLWYRKISMILGSRARAARFDDVDKRINNCLFELSAASGASIEKKIDRLSVASARDHHHHPGANKSNKTEGRARNAPQKGATGQGGQNGGKGGKNRRGRKKAADATATRPPPPPVFPHAGIPNFHQNGHCCTVHHHHSMEEDPISCSVM